MRRIALGAAIAAVWLGAAASAVVGETGSAGTRETQVVRKVLDNGLTVIVKPEQGSGLVAIAAFVGAGAAQESFQNAGLGNFVAHLLLASTRQKSAEMVAAVADEVGGNIGVEWHPDFTHLRAITTAARFSDAMYLIGECLTEANFEDRWVEQVREDFLRRLEFGERDPIDRAYTNLRELLYEDNGYRRPLTGFRRTVEKATPQDLRRFFETYYVPNNMVICVAGDVSADYALDRVDMAFAGVRPAQLPVNRGVPDETLETSRYRALEVELPVAYLLLGWLAPGVGSPDYAPMAVAVNALGGGKGSLMFRELRQKRGMGYDVGARYPRFRYQSHVIAHVVTSPFKTALPSMSPPLVLEEVRAALIEQVQAIRDNPLSADDLERAKGYTVGTYALQHQRLLDRAFHLGWLEIIGLGHEFDRTFAQSVDAVSAEDVQRVARKYLGNYAAVLLLPKTQSPPAGQP